jgi:aldehyde dehydrogenase (NAD+)
MAPDTVSTNLFNIPAQSKVYHDPLGVVLVMGAWNYNVMLTLDPLVGAIAGGNCALVKPGSYASKSAEVMKKLIARYMDSDCIQVITGDRTVTAQILDERFDMIFFTGSTFVGKIVAQAAAKTLTPTVLELGGKSPCIVDKTADLAVAARRIAWGGLLNSGQTCVRPDYFMVHDSVADAFVEKLKATIAEFYSQDPKASEWYGRIINTKSHKRLVELVEDARHFLVHGGTADEAAKYIEPTVFDFGTNMAAFEKSKVMEDEVFGPLFPICRFSDPETLVQFVNARPKPLATYCFTEDADLKKAVLERTSSGAAVINDVVVHLSNPDLPFGGVGDSGMGAYHGDRSFGAFTHRKAVLLRESWGDAFVRYPPYTPLKQNALALLTKPALGHIYSYLSQLITDKKNLFIFFLLFMLLRKWRR